MCYSLGQTPWFYNNFSRTFLLYYNYFRRIGKYWKKDSDTACKAVSYSASIRRSDFLISLEIVAELFSFTRILSLVFQSSKSKAYSHVKDIIDVIVNIIENSVSEFEK